MSKRKPESESESEEDSKQSQEEEVSEESSEEVVETKPKKTKKKKAPAKAKPKKKKAKKDPNAPKKPTTAYAFYLKVKRAEFQAKHPDLKFGDLSRKIAAAWRALEKDAKQEFTDKYLADKIRYEKEMSTYKKPSTESDDSSEEESSKKKRKKATKKKKDPNAPKQATNAYMFFQKEQREKIKKDNPTLKTLPQLAKKMGEIWGNMNDEQKKKYQEQAGQDKLRYEEENKAYKEKLELEKKEKQAAKKAEKEEDEEGEDSEGEEESE